MKRNRNNVIRKSSSIFEGIKCYGKKKVQSEVKRSGWLGLRKIAMRMLKEKPFQQKKQ